MDDKPARRIAHSRTEEILDFFGKCRACGYPAYAETTTLRYETGEMETKVIASCALPCGWTGEVSATPMTEPAGRART
ncbi:hypothetical protein LTT66_01070 [Nocardia gipuzkoensis]|uniref:hypothetical protein n=1 Tax=Nocardia gipuzkoensis TaxID=2749991 RepID=UPI001E2CC949|nr:hypothetical protein [Nocardia gipuzkoensis]UGT68862.1 hypothetical protein LTT66_01070 [Nocardia gipuzkoensis]